MLRPPLTNLFLALGTTAVLSAALLNAAQPVVTTTSADAGAPVITTASVVRAVTPHTPTRLPAAIESPGGYTEQVSCDPRIRPGTRKLARLLAGTYPAARNWASTYACGTDGTRSEHYDGRAIDWMVDVHNSGQLKAAKATIAWLLATDRAGNRFAMARRLGVMYLIFNNRIWGGWSGRWEEYNGCSKLKGRGNDNACHRTHMHISLTWNGAMGRTSFWTRKVARTDFGPCRVSGLNWAPRYRHANLLGCPSVPSLKAPKGASARKKALVTWSGAGVGPGSRGPAVTAVQSALGVAATGNYGTSTKNAVRRFQSRHHLTVTGGMNVPTWLALLRAVR